MLLEKNATVLIFITAYTVNMIVITPVIAHVIPKNAIIVWEVVSHQAVQGITVVLILSVMCAMDLKMANV